MEKRLPVEAGQSHGEFSPFPPMALFRAGDVTALLP